MLRDKSTNFLQREDIAPFSTDITNLFAKKCWLNSTVQQWNRILLEDATSLTDAWGRPSMSEAYCVEVRDVFPQMICLAPVQAHLLAARLQHGIARNVSLQNVLGMAPADIV